MSVNCVLVALEVYAIHVMKLFELQSYNVIVKYCKLHACEHRSVLGPTPWFKPYMLRYRIESRLNSRDLSRYRLSHIYKTRRVAVQRAVERDEIHYPYKVHDTTLRPLLNVTIQKHNYIANYIYRIY